MFWKNRDCLRLTTFSSLGALLGVAAVAVAGDLHRRSVWMLGSLALIGMVSLVCSVSAFFSPALRRLNGPLDEVADRFAAVEHACHETGQTENGHA